MAAGFFLFGGWRSLLGDDLGLLEASLGDAPSEGFGASAGPAGVPDGLGAVFSWMTWRSWSILVSSSVLAFSIPSRLILMVSARMLHPCWMRLVYEPAWSSIPLPLRNPLKCWKSSSFSILFMIVAFYAAAAGGWRPGHYARPTDTGLRLGSRLARAGITFRRGTLARALPEAIIDHFPLYNH